MRTVIITNLVDAPQRLILLLDENSSATYTIPMFTLIIPRLQFASLLLLSLALFTSAPVRAGQSPVGIDSIPICMNFSCREKQTIAISPEEWDSIANWLRPSAVDAQTERLNIKNAIGWMEVIVGRHTPTHRDVGGDLGNPDATYPGQLDCIDESLNTTTYLKLFEENGLLKHHKVIERAYRRAVLDQHWAGQIETLEGSERWVVDSWFQHNGYLPYVQKSEKWEDINIFFTANLDSSQPKPKKEGSFFGRLFN